MSRAAFASRAMNKLVELVIITFHLSSKGLADQCDIKAALRFDCFPGSNLNEQDCARKGCCWKPHNDSQGEQSNTSVPSCFYGPINFGYKVISTFETSTGFDIDLALFDPGGLLNGCVSDLRAQFLLESDSRIHIKISDRTRKRYEVPTPSPKIKGKFGSLYEVTYTQFPFGFTVKRRRNGNKVFHTGVGGFVFCDQFIQISSLLPSHNIYGLGEHLLPFKLSTQWTKLTLFARDAATPPGSKNLYGSHPFYLNIDDKGEASGVFLKNSNAMDIILQPASAITYRTIGGILDFYIFTGPSSARVISEYTEVIGRPAMPPYWALGFHLCRFGYRTLEKMMTVRERVRKYMIPQDTQWTDIDYAMKKKDFTLDRKRFRGLDKFIQRLHSEGMRYVILVDPGISTSDNYKPYSDGVLQNVFVKDSKGDILIGKVWPGETAFPDFFHPNTSIYWHNQIRSFRRLIEFDGLWIDMNEPSNWVQGSIHGCANNSLNHPPYIPGVIGGKLYDHTLCMDAQHHNGLHYNLHSLYGHSQAVVTAEALQKILGKRTFVLTRSSFSGTGSYAANWLGDNHSRWKDLRDSISGILNFNLFGIPFVGADICGFNGDTNEELCSRWMQLGAFYPFSRNHNSVNQIDQDPAAFGDRLVVASRAALNVRYTLLPYLYTLFHAAHAMGETVARPLFFEFPGDRTTYNIDTQFMWGRSLLISPVLHQGAVSVKAYLPKATWYEYYTGEVVESQGDYFYLPAAFDKVNLHVRECSIIIIQEPDLTTKASRRNDFGLIVSPCRDGTSSALGNLFLDDGESFLEKGHSSYVRFECLGNKLTSEIRWKNYIPEHQNLGHIKLLGVPVEPENVLVNGQFAYSTYDKVHGVLLIDSLKLSVVKNFSVIWL